jgi:lipoprotein NlpD
LRRPPVAAAIAPRGALLLLLPVLLLAACAGGPPAPIEDRGRGGTARSDQRYTVLPGDTLYAIAFRHGLEYRRLAAANDIAAPYLIYPGQALWLREATAVPRPATAEPGGKRRAAVSPPPAATGKAPVPPAAAPGASAGTVPAVTKTTAPAPPQPDASSAVRTWLWPAGGRVLRAFDASLHKGIDIGGARGDAVRAAAGGRVVYAGSGIAGYGLMLILRHNDEYLSAYGHNDELLVTEGSTVRAGDPIARLGSSGTDGVKLHFEIRRGGRPVDPRDLLPPR